MPDNIGVNNQTSEQEDSPLSQSDYLHDAYKTVPEIGVGHRWYDLPYRVLHRILRSRVGKHLPKKVKEGLVYLVNYLIPFFSFDLDLAWSREDPMHNLIVPPDEHVRIPGVWVCDLFPPSRFENLKQALDCHGWDKRRLLIGSSNENQEMLGRIRTDDGGSWWRIGSVIPTSSQILAPDAVRENLPTEFRYISVMGLKVGPSLTAIVAHFEFTDQSQCSIDNVWHAIREPRIIWGRGLPRSEDRLWSGYSETQGERARLQTLARKWMADNFPGMFAIDKSSQQPLLALLLLSEYDPSQALRRNRVFNDPLRAIGITEYDFFQNVSEDLPGLFLEQVNQFLCPALNGENTWTLWGQTTKVFESVPDAYSNGRSEYNAINLYVSDPIHVFFLRLAMSSFLKLIERQYSSLRDNARSRHGRFSNKDLKELRENFLGISLDTSGIVRDIESFTTRVWGIIDDIHFFRKLAPWVERSERERGRTIGEPIDLVEELNIHLNKKAEELIQFDCSYRDILSTVASIGASISARKIQITAIIIAIIALFVGIAGLIRSAFY